MESFYDSFLENLDSDEIRTIFYTAKQSSNSFFNIPVFREFPQKDAEAMSLSMAITLELLRRYENFKNL